MLRNFWLDIDVDGRSTPVRTGSREGGFRQEVFVNSSGNPTKVLEVEGYLNPQGQLCLLVTQHYSNKLSEVSLRIFDKVKGEV